jgi:hypothetical protein
MGVIGAAWGCLGVHTLIRSGRVRMAPKSSPGTQNFSVNFAVREKNGRPRVGMGSLFSQTSRVRTSLFLVS